MEHVGCFGTLAKVNTSVVATVKTPLDEKRVDSAPSSGQPPSNGDAVTVGKRPVTIDMNRPPQPADSLTSTSDPLESTPTLRLELPPSTECFLEELAKQVEQGHHVLIQGPADSGKSFIVGEYARRIGRDLCEVDLGVCRDVHDLTGEWVPTSTGCFKFAPSALAQSCRDGRIVLLADLDQCNEDTQRFLAHVIKYRECPLKYPGPLGQPLMCAEQFKIDPRTRFVCTVTPSQYAGREVLVPELIDALTTPSESPDVTKKSRVIEMTPPGPEDLVWVAKQTVPGLDDKTAKALVRIHKAIEEEQLQHRLPSCSSGHNYTLRDFTNLCRAYKPGEDRVKALTAAARATYEPADWPVVQDLVRFCSGA